MTLPQLFMANFLENFLADFLPDFLVDFFMIRKVKISILYDKKIRILFWDIFEENSRW